MLTYIKDKDCEVDISYIDQLSAGMVPFFELIWRPRQIRHKEDGNVVTSPVDCCKS